MTKLVDLEQIIRSEFFDIVQQLYYPAAYKIRRVLTDNSFVDIYLSMTIKNVFAFHWERRHLNKTIFRYDNYPHQKWANIKTFPYHLHYKQESKVIAVTFRKQPTDALHDFFTFVRKQLVEK